MHENLPLSVYTGPETVEPSPYSIVNVPLFLAPVDDAPAEYLCLLRHVELVHDALGTQRSDEPVSKSMRNVWPGVPIAMLPAHSSSLSSSVSGSVPVARFARAAGAARKSLICQPAGSAPLFARRLRRFFWYLLQGDARQQHVRSGARAERDNEGTHLWTWTLWRTALSWSKVPSALVSTLRSPRGMRTPPGWATGPAEARRARATETSVALQNMVGGRAGGEQEQETGAWWGESRGVAPAGLSTPGARGVAHVRARGHVAEKQGVRYAPCRFAAVVRWLWVAPRWPADERLARRGWAMRGGCEQPTWALVSRSRAMGSCAEAD